MQSTSFKLGNSDLATALREHRGRHRLSQNQLAIRLGVTQQSVARWEKGAPCRRDMLQVIRAELAGEPLEQDAGAEVIDLHPGINEPNASPHSVAMRDKWVKACMKCLDRGGTLPDWMLEAISRYVGLPLGDINGPGGAS